MHFIRAFPIVLCIVLILGCSFVFADDEWIVGSSPITLTDTPIHYLASVDNVIKSNDITIPTFVYGYSGSDNRLVIFSLAPTTAQYIGASGNVSTLNVSIPIDVGDVRYYYSTIVGAQSFSSNIPVVSSSSLSNSIGFVNENYIVQSNSILFNITKFIQASNIWLSSIVGTVMANPLLIFILLFYFVGTAIGLLFRFRRN